ncbi:hypothetical protein VNO77_32580 [Canavalia gladiata]|uniref:Uncharacterized protein n=1 Tax=Canavalia gladiata TaxID=3824 RepID=A0AAN9KQ85_CANGL
MLHSYIDKPLNRTQIATMVAEKAAICIFLPGNWFQLPCSYHHSLVSLAISKGWTHSLRCCGSSFLKEFHHLINGFKSNPIAPSPLND